jgi:hydroxymethylglutaryl-CoA synthase
MEENRTGIIGFATYIPYWRLRRDTVAAALGGGSARGSRAVAGFDEDTTTMAVAAARSAVRAIGGPAEVDAVWLATADPVYADKANATTVHAALGLPARAHAADLAGSVRSGTAALLAALHAPGRSLVALSDRRTGPSGSPEESGGGDAAAALVLGRAGAHPLLAEFLGTGSATAEFLDRWRAPGEPWSATWEERFGERLYTSLAEESMERAAKAAGLTPDGIDRIAITGPAPRAVGAAAKKLGVRPERLADDLTSAIGNTGTAHPAILLAAMLEQAAPGDVLALIVLADGADTLLFRCTDALVDRTAAPTVADGIARGRDTLSYADFLSWRGLLSRQQPRRPAPDRAAAPASQRATAWKFGFTGSRCTECGTRHLPPQRVCLRCGVTDRMADERLADTLATVATYTVDHLAFSLAPPVVAAVVDFDGGGRFSCELTDMEADALAVGQRVEMTFRRISTADGIHNYFWKARPASGESRAKNLGGQR